MYFLESNDSFPEVSLADEDGLLAFSGELTTSRLLEAYKKGIFPWFEDNQPVLWWSPNPRFVLYPSELKVSKSMKQFMRNCNLEITVNKNFRAVITECALAKREGQTGTWITNTMIDAYVELHKMGYAKSVEVYNDNTLVGGLYGIDIGNGVFCGESMFAKQSNASKAAFITFIQNTNYKLIDCQVYTNHLESLGAKEISRALFLTYL